MTDGVALGLAVAVVILGAGMLFAYLRTDERQGSGLSKMVDNAIHVPANARKEAAVRVPAQLVPSSSWMRLPFTFAIRRTWGMTLATPWLILLAGVGSASAWLMLRGLLHMPYWAVLPGMALAGFFLPRYVLLRQRRRTDARFLAEFPDAIDMIVRMVRSGLPVAAAIRTVSEKASPTVATVFALVADRCEIGVPLEEALADMSEQVGLADFRFFAVTLGLQRTTGGNLARTLETFGEIVRKRRAVRQKAVAATAEVRMSAIILGGLPLVVIGGMAIISPDYLEPMINDPRGNIMAGVAMLMMAAGGLSMRWLVRSGSLA
jgi:tight adherence protein B